MHGFADADAVMTGVETRSSSPVRIVRDEGLQAVMAGSGAAAAQRGGVGAASARRTAGDAASGSRPSVAGEPCGSGLYPCGEGAGYAGGIMSAACDGLRVAQAVAGDVAC